MENFYIFLKKHRSLCETTIVRYVKDIYFLKKNNYFNDEKIIFSQSNNRKRVLYSALKQYYAFLEIKPKIPLTLPKKENKIQSYVTHDEYQLIHDYLIRKNNKNSRLKLCLIKLLYETGIRSAEVLSIKLTDIQENKILINGKGNKQRNVWMSQSLKFELDAYINYFQIKNYLFTFKYKNLYKKIRGLGKIIDKKITPHMFRRGFATYCIKKNIDIYSLSQMMGHSDLNTTKTYIYDFDLQNKMQNLFT